MLLFFDNYNPLSRLISLLLLLYLSLFNLSSIIILPVTVKLDWTDSSIFIFESNISSKSEGVLSSFFGSSVFTSSKGLSKSKISKSFFITIPPIL